MNDPAFQFFGSARLPSGEASLTGQPITNNGSEAQPRVMKNEIALGKASLTARVGGKPLYDRHPVSHDN